MITPSTGKVTLKFDFSFHSDGDHIGIWLRDIANDGTLSVLIQAMWECGEGIGYYTGKLDRATTGAMRKTYEARLRAAESATKEQTP